jgi:anti-sigma regulatory factor (Ser/Thr protein kinase)
LGRIPKDPKGITAAVVDRFKISRQAAARYLKQMVRDGQLEGKGTTKNRSYAVGVSQKVVKKYALDSLKDESLIWERDFKTFLKDLKENVVKICAYGFTEMVNNAIDHSKGKMLTISFERNPRNVVFQIADNGVGIFRKIKESYHLSDERQALLELSKGKLTTDPAKHTGEGIFFTSRIFDLFSIYSHDLAFSHQEAIQDDYLLHQKKEMKGTVVFLELRTNSQRNIKDTFDEFADPQNDYSFDKTVVPVRLAQYEGEDLLSRSQAKRLMIRVERFKTVMLDFEGVQSVGPAFADEIFRVYKNEHPKVKLIPIHTSEEVKKMIKRAEASGS